MTRSSSPLDFVDVNTYVPKMYRHWQVCAASSLKSEGLLTLQPGKTGRLPASDGTPMPLVVERPFKAAGHVVTGTVTHCCHGLSRGETSAS